MERFQQQIYTNLQEIMSQKSTEMSFGVKFSSLLIRLSPKLLPALGKVHK